MDRELGRIQVDQAFRSLEAAINHVDNTDDTNIS
jgi:hypothetical protein